MERMPSLNKEPGDAVGRVILGEDQVRLPDEAVVPDLKRQRPELCPNGLEAGLEFLHGLEVHGVGGAVQRHRPQALIDLVHQSLYKLSGALGLGSACFRGHSVS